MPRFDFSPERYEYNGVRFSMLGQVVKFYRASLGMTQQQLEEACGLGKGDSARISKLESGDPKAFKPEQLNKLLKFLGVGTKFDSLKAFVHDATEPDGTIKPAPKIERVSKKNMKKEEGTSFAEQLAGDRVKNIPESLLKHNTSYIAAMRHVDENTNSCSPEEVNVAKQLLKDFFSNPDFFANKSTWSKHIEAADEKAQQTTDAVSRVAYGIYADALENALNKKKERGK